MASKGKKTLDSSAIVEMEVIATDESDYEADFDGQSGRPISSGNRSEIDGESGNKEDIRGQISKGVASYVWEEGRTRASKAFSLYANIDILRPYYDVEPHEVRKRLIQSLIPNLTKNSDGRSLKVPHELYGPTMLTFTMIALLLYQMKSSGHTVREGTLMGSAFATCFGYWFGISGLLWVISYVCSTRVRMTQLLNLLGYSLFGPCLVLFFTTVLHSVHTHLFFYLLWLVFGGLSAFKLATVLMSRTSGRSQKFIIAGIVVSLHLLFLLYLHFAYHRVVEDVSEVFEAGPRLQGQPVPPQHVLEEATQHVAASEDMKSKFAQDKKNLVSPDAKESPVLPRETLPAIEEDSKDSAHKSVQRRSAEEVKVEGGTSTEVSTQPNSSGQAGEKPSDPEKPPADDKIDDGKPVEDKSTTSV